MALKLNLKMRPANQAVAPTEEGLPGKLMEHILNRRGFRRQRLVAGRDKDFQIHVSDLIKVEKSRMFCPREHAISYLTDHPEYISYMMPGLEILFEVGHAIHDLVVRKFQADEHWGGYLWGTWACACGKTTVDGFKPPPAPYQACHLCKTVPTNYKELDLVMPDYRIVGHADMLIKYNDVIRIYETKTIDRAGVDFDSMTGPLGDHTLQASFYYWILRKMGYNVHQVIRYLYVDRSNDKLFRGDPYKTFHVRASPAERIQPFIDKAKALLQSIKTGQLTDRLPQCTDAQCTRAKNCKVAATCFMLKSNALTPKTVSFSGDRPLPDGHRGSSVERRPTGIIRPVLRKPS